MSDKAPQFHSISEYGVLTAVASTHAPHEFSTYLLYFLRYNNFHDNYYVFDFTHTRMSP